MKEGRAITNKVFKRSKGEILEERKKKKFRVVRGGKMRGEKKGCVSDSKSRLLQKKRKEEKERCFWEEESAKKLLWRGSETPRSRKL